MIQPLTGSQPFARLHVHGHAAASRSAGDFGALLRSADAGADPPASSYDDPNWWQNQIDPLTGKPYDPNVNPVTGEAENSSLAGASFNPAAGAGRSALSDCADPGALQVQMLQNQIGNSFQAMFGGNLSDTAQLPEYPSAEAQGIYDHTLAFANAQRLAKGLPLVNTQYWGDPGGATVGGKTYTAQDLGYVAPFDANNPYLGQLSGMPSASSRAVRPGSIPPLKTTT